MAALESTIHIISPELTLLNDKIRERLSTSNPLMNQVIESFLRNKGKQLRPIILLLTAKMFGDINDSAIAAASAVELLHNASLIHDDVVDNSMMRRNSPSINAVWDNHIAVLIGDFFVSTAMQQAISTGNVDIIDSLCMLGRTLSIGELDQIYNARFHQISEEAYFNIIYNKTASLFVTCARMGCHSAGVVGDDLEAMTRFAGLLGLCFQLRDDIFDYFSDEKVGKPTGNDLKEGKITLPLLYALSDSSNPEHNKMKELSMKPELTDTEIRTLINFAIDNGGIEYTYRKMGELRDEAAGILASLPAGDARDAMLVVLDSIITRDH
ncbi:MAG: polyprenyl synthetase family protein [Muribaculaceae bacterium]|nr:polyprenyl synthetase family protein [Muribaculaceae bacterium]